MENLHAACQPTADTLAGWVADARARTLALVDDLGDEQMMGPQLAIINPLLWEISHVAWFQEKWVLRHVLGRAPLRADADRLFDSIAIPHDTRWDLPLPSRRDTYAYLAEVRDRVLQALARDGASPELRYHALYSVFHEDMHDEAFTYTRQTLAYRPPALPAPPPLAAGGLLPGDAEVPGGTYLLGASPEEPFVFDNEKWAHAVEVAPFRIARGAVSQGEYAPFVEDGGYQHPELWSPAGREWRQRAGVEGPLYWRREGGGWLRRDFDRWVTLEPHRAMVHVSAYEAEAWCAWAGRRLPSEAEWEAAAAGAGPERRRLPWGEEPAGGERANLDGLRLGCTDVGALAAGDTPEGCRQLLGNVWEWTATEFAPYPGFTPDPYREYSQPWFGTHRVLRGGAWTTRARLLRNTWRNFYTPDRRDVWAGFRTCAR
ncbi:MAG TPA: selenoneine synthase SenA [Thermoanaerobaculia bacterium]|nr:selenoneine synthase SenA [Thermoanaerobaculia bacterium]